MKVSVVIPAYNQGRFLRETIESVLRSTKPAEEIIVVDDGSTDETAAVCREFGDQIVYLHQANGGVSAARNAGLKRATSDAIMLLDADDVLLSDWIEVACRTLERVPRKRPKCHVVHGDYLLFDNDGAYEKRVASKKVGLRHFLRDSNVLPSGLLMTRACVDLVGEFDGSVNTCEDWDYSLRAALLGIEFHNVRHLAFRHREHSEGASKRQTRALEVRLRFLRKWVGSELLSPAQRAIVKEEIVRTLMRCRRDAFFAGRPTKEWTEAACRELGDEPFDAWFVTYGSVYLAPYFRKSLAPESVVDSATTLGVEWFDALSAQRKAGRSVGRRIDAAVALALAADGIAARDWRRAARSFVKSLRRDPSVLLDGLARGSRQVEEALRALA